MFVRSPQRAGPRSAPLDLRFVDLFMAIILALAFLSLLLLLVAGIVAPSRGIEPNQATKISELTSQVQILEKQLAQERSVAGAALAENQQLKASIAHLGGNFALPWWLLATTLILDVAALASLYLRMIEDARVRLSRQVIGLAVAVAVLAALGLLIRAVTGLPRQIVSVIGLSWWAFLLLALGEFLTLIVMLGLVTNNVIVYRRLRQGIEPRTTWVKRQL
jgi:hypothetical protein